MPSRPGPHKWLRDRGTTRRCRAFFRRSAGSLAESDSYLPGKGAHRRQSRARRRRIRPKALARRQPQTERTRCKISRRVTSPRKRRFDLASCPAGTRPRSAEHSFQVRMLQKRTASAGSPRSILPRPRSDDNRNDVMLERGAAVGFESAEWSCRFPRWIRQRGRLRRRQPRDGSMEHVPWTKDEIREEQFLRLRDRIEQAVVWRDGGLRFRLRSLSQGGRGR